MFEAGAGKIGNYECCSWQTLGRGQFKPLPGSQPYIGSTNQLETLIEYKLELIVPDDLIKTVIEQMKQAHPYEQPAYDVWQLNQL